MCFYERERRLRSRRNRATRSPTVALIIPIPGGQCRRHGRLEACHGAEELGQDEIWDELPCGFLGSHRRRASG